jgi:hypothetical protein
VDNNATIGRGNSMQQELVKQQSTNGKTMTTIRTTTTTTRQQVVFLLYGLVNTSRGEVRTGPRSRSQPDNVASLLGAYLAAATLGSISGSDENENGEENGSGLGLGRLLREERGAGGGGGGGIDIHIHAVVTAPGVGTGGLGLATLGGATPTAATLGGTRNLFSSARDRSSRSPSSLLRPRNPSFSHILANNDDDHDIADMGLFSELYSENPTPLHPNGSPEPGERGATMPALSDVNHQNDDTTEFLARISNAGGFSMNASGEDHTLGRSSIRRTRRSSPKSLKHEANAASAQIREASCQFDEETARGRFTTPTKYMSRLVKAFHNSY